MQSLVIFSVYIIDLSESPESPLTKFEDTTKTGGAVSILEHRVRIQNGLDKLEKLSGQDAFQKEFCISAVLGQE